MNAGAAITLTVLLAGLAAFQAALVAGAPIGQFAWGGQHVRLPRGLRFGSAIAILIYAGISVVALQRAAVVSLFPAGDWVGIAAWVIVGYLILGIPLNAISRSRPERLTMTPLVCVLAALALVVALGL